MAYSNSTWKAFWSTKHSKKTLYKLPNKKLKSGQYLLISDALPYVISYGDLQSKGLGNILDEVRDYYSETKRPDAKEMHGLIEILDQFKYDVDEHFQFWEFIKYEWLYPIRNKIRLWKSKRLTKDTI